MKRITRNQALRILIRHAASDVAGAGCGIRMAITDAERMQVARAVARVHLEAHGYHADGAVFSNLGIPESDCDSFGRQRAPDEGQP